ncbi:MAG: hypothetical protein JNL57_06455 [Bacteroidetes bacterium]|nr:hypothetical protein [Bacteroidota bacterium]
MAKWHTGLALLFAFVQQGAAQIVWYKAPTDLAFIPRQSGVKTGKAIFDGLVVQKGYTGVQIDVFRNSAAYGNYSSSLTYSGDSAPVYLSVPLLAGKWNYTMHVYLISSGSKTKVHTASQVVAGDVFLVNGQSNSVANQYSGSANSAYKDSFIRSFGSSSYSWPSMVNDLNWYIADGDGYYNKGCIGQWALVLGKKIVDSTGIPVCFINNGVGGTPITFHQRNNSNHADVTTNYGRMLYRAQKAGLDKNIKGILFYQGESDGASAVHHDTMFRKMHAAWLEDYKGVEHIYVVQVRSGCGSPSLQLREFQRRFGTDLPRTTAVTANGLNGHDGCHFAFANGYEQLGLNLFQLFACDYYGRKDDGNRHFPEPALAWYSNAQHTAITLSLSGPNPVVSADSLFYRLFSVAGSTAYITGGRIQNNQVVLYLSKSDCGITGLNYDGLPGSQPWVRNARGQALMSFYNFKIWKQKPLSTLYSCPNTPFKLGTDSISGYTYSWTAAVNGQKSSRAMPEFRIAKTEMYRLITTSANTGCAKDTQFQTVYVDATPRPWLGNDTTLCPGDSVLLTTGTGSWAKQQWIVNGKFQSFAPKIRILETSQVILLVTSAAKCNLSDTTVIRIARQLTHSENGYTELCAGKDTSLYGDKMAVRWLWNGVAGQWQHKTRVTTLLVQTDSFGCSDSTWFPVHSRNKPVISIQTAPSICVGNQLVQKLPGNLSGWLFNGIPVDGDSIRLNATDTGWLVAKDDMGCPADTWIAVKPLSLPVFKLYDTFLCNRQPVTLAVDIKGKSYEWSNGQSGKSCYITTVGELSLQITDENKCRYSDTLLVADVQSPVFRLPADTFYCTGDSLRLYAGFESAWFRVNQKNESVRFTISTPGAYSLLAYDKPGCSSSFHISVSEISCQSGLDMEDETNWRLIKTGSDYTLTGLPASTLYLYDEANRWVWTANCAGGKCTLPAWLKPGVYFFQVQPRIGKRITAKYFLQP